MDYAGLLKTVLLGACLSLGMITSSNAAKMYKIVDAQGHTTFSQYPPKKSEVAADTTVESKNVSANSETSVSIEDGVQYCGKIALPSIQKKRTFSKLSQTKKYWKRDLDREQERLNKQTRDYDRHSNSGYRVKSMGKKGKRIRDLRCALRWASAFDEKISAIKNQKTAHVEKIQNKLTALEARRDNSCGLEPEFDPGAQGNKRKIRSWEICNRQYKNDIQKLKRNLYRASKNY